MTSSLKATGHAAIRGTPAASVVGAATWALTELGPSTVSGTRSGTNMSAPTATPEERARLVAEGYAAGIIDGERKGMELAEARVKESLGLIEKLTTQLNAAAALAPSILEENIAAISVIVARQIVGREVTTTPEIVADLVRRALTEFPIEQAVRIRVHPLDLSLLTLAGTGQGTQPITGSREASWLADDRIGRGGCLIEGRDRIVDGRIDAALERAYHRMAQIDAS
jgi:flagellar biosynthesis/type III secretory pathway protein FliH